MAKVSEALDQRLRSVQLAAPPAPLNLSVSTIVKHGVRST